MITEILRSIKLSLIMIGLVCGAYPLAVYGIGSLLFPDQTQGSFVRQDERVVGSKLIGQAFTKPGYFHGRPSAAGDPGYDPMKASGSNFGPTSLKLQAEVRKNVEKVLQENPTLTKGNIPVELVTSSASGLDPHLSPDAALVQVERVARTRNRSEDEIKIMIAKHTEGPQFGFLGQSRVNLLMLNLDLDQTQPVKRNQRFSQRQKLTDQNG